MTKMLRTLVVLASLVGAHIAQAQPYCFPMVGFQGCWTGEDLNSVTMGSLVDLNTGCTVSIGYNDRTNLPAPVLQVGSMQSFTLTSNALQMFFGIYIDLNSDGDFQDANEFVWANTVATNNVTSSFMVPVGSGTRRMRIKALSQASPVTQSQECTWGWGETHDYNVILSASSCAPPTNITASYVAGTSATINYTSTGTSFEVDYGTVGHAPGTGTVVTSTTTSKTLTGLSSSTGYHVYVRRICSPTDQSSWNGPLLLTTRCETNNAFPFVESFDGTAWIGVPNNAGSGDAFSNCWLRTPDVYNFNTMFVVRTGSTTGTLTGASGAFGGTGNYLHMMNSFNIGFSAIAELPQQNLSGLATPELTFYYHMYGANMGALYIEASTNGGVSWVKLDSIVGQQQTAKTSAWLPKTLSLASVKTTYTQIRFRGVGGGNYGSICIDQVSIAQAPACPNPQGVSVSNIKGTQATLNWNLVSGNIYYVEYGPEGFTQGTGAPLDTVTGSGSYIMTGLMGEEYYDVYLKTRCSPTDVSLWMGPYTFRTHAVPNWVDDMDPFLPDNRWMKAQGVLANPTTFTLTTNSNWTTDGYLNVGTTGCARVGVYNAGSREDWFITKTTDLGTGNNYELHFDAGITAVGSTSSATMAANDKLRVVISTDNGATWNLSNVIFDIGPTSGITNLGTTYVVPLTGYSGLVKIGFYMSRPATAAQQYDFFIDNVGIRTPLPCSAPNGMATGTVAATSIQFTWNPKTGNPTYQIEYGPAGFNQGTGTIVNGIATNSHTVVGLNPTTQYSFYFRTLCATDTSSWAGPITVFTGCPAVFATPYTTNFDNVTSGYPTGGTFENCWKSVEPSQVYHWRSGSGITSPSTGPNGDHTTGSGKYMFTNALFTGAEANLVGGPFSLVGLTQPMLKFYYHMYGSTMGNLYVEISEDGVNWNNLTAIKGEKQTANNAPWGEAKLPLSQYVGDTIYVRFRGERGSSSNSNMAIDDISITNGTSCLAPAGLRVLSTTATSATISWGTYQSSTSIEYGLMGYTQGTGAGTKVHNAAPGIVVTGLAPGTNYDLYVRDTCNPSIWIGPLSFSTPCLAALSGTYTIGGVPGPSNFVTLQTAFSALNTCGISGPVTLHLTGGKQIGLLNLGQISGSSATNTITVQGTLGADSVVFPLGQSGLQLNGTKHITFKNITFFKTDDDLLVWLRNGTSNVSFDSCIFITSSTTSFTSAHIAACSVAGTPVSSGNNANHLSVTNCTFNEGYYGLVLIGDVTTNTVGYTLKNNTFTNQYNSAIHGRYLDSASIENNVINTGIANSSSYGIYLLGTKYALVNANDVTAQGTSIILSTAGTATAGNLISNNMVKGPGTGLLVSNSANTLVYHNSVLVTGIALNASGSGNSDLNVRNNILVSVNNYAYQQGAAANVNVDYNIYHRQNSGNIAQDEGVNYATLAAWKAAKPAKNINALQGNPNFYSNTNLHVFGTLANNAGVTIAGIAKDFDGQTRPMAPATTVDIGADEFTPKLLDAAVLAIFDPLGNCGNASTTVSIAVKNLGSTTITSLPASVVATGSLSATLSGTFTVNIPFGDTDTITIGTLNTANVNGLVTLTATSNLVNDEDVSNDVATRQISFIPATPTALPQIPGVCLNADSATFTALPVSNATYGWYASQTAATPTDTGDAFTYALSQQTDWWLDYYPIPFDQLVAQNPNVIGYGGGVMFNVEAFKNVSIDSVRIICTYPPNSGFRFEAYYVPMSSVAGNEIDSTQWILHERINLVSTGALGQNIVFTNPLNLPAGSTYALYFNFPGNAILSSQQMPQTFANQSIKITAGNALLGKFFYPINYRQFSGTIFTHENSCSSGRTLVQTAFRADTAVASFTTAVSPPNKVDVNASASQGNIIEWTFGDGGTATGTIASHTYINGGTYTITCVVTDTACGTTDTATFTVQMTIGVDENELANRVNIYPNPSRGLFTLSINVPGTEDVAVSVVDGVGRTIKRLSYNPTSSADMQIDLTEHPSGLYFIHLHIGNSVVVKKISKL